MTEPPTDPDAGADASNSAGSERDVAGGREFAVDADRQATPRLANATGDGDEEEEVDPSRNDPGALRDPEPIEPESLSAENVLFVLLGVLGTVALLATAIVPGIL